MMPTPKLSLIVPMYNARSTIEYCLGSLLAGANEDVEILVVDDGSTDGSADLIRQTFAAPLAAGRLIILQQANQGISGARNTGLDRASGRYIGFVDSDDIVAADYFDHLLGAIDHQPADIIEFGHHRWNGKFPVQPGEIRHALSRFGQIARSDIEREAFGTSMWYTWTRLFHRDLFANIRFPLGIRFCEDLMTLARIYPMATTITNLAAAPYHYRINPSGATLAARPEYITELVSYYLTLPDTPDDCTDLLKMAIQFCIYSCQQNMGLPYEMDPRLDADLRRVRRRIGLYRYIPLRRIRVLWLPRFSRWLTRTLARDIKLL